jgi:hypothetical protein
MLEAHKDRSVRGEFYTSQATKLFIPDPISEIVSRESSSFACAHVAEALRTWECRFQISPGEVDIVMSIAGSLGNILEADEAALKLLPLETKTRRALHLFFGVGGEMMVDEECQRQPQQTDTSWYGFEHNIESSEHDQIGMYDDHMMVVDPSNSKFHFSGGGYFMPPPVPSQVSILPTSKSSSRLEGTFLNHPPLTHFLSSGSELECRSQEGLGRSQNAPPLRRQHPHQEAFTSRDPAATATGHIISNTLPSSLPTQQQPRSSNNWQSAHGRMIRGMRSTTRSNRAAFPDFAITSGDVATSSSMYRRNGQVVPPPSMGYNKFFQGRC